MWPGLALGLYTTGTVALCLHKCYLRYAPVCRIRYSNIYEWFMLVFAHCIWWNNLKHSSSVCVCVWQMIKRNYDYDELSMQLQHGAISFVSVCVCVCVLLHTLVRNKCKLCTHYQAHNNNNICILSVMTPSIWVWINAMSYRSSDYFCWWLQLQRGMALLYDGTVVQ